MTMKTHHSRCLAGCRPVPAFCPNILFPYARESVAAINARGPDPSCSIGIGPENKKADNDRRVDNGGKPIPLDVTQDCKRQHAESASSTQDQGEIIFNRFVMRSGVDDVTPGIHP